MESLESLEAIRDVFSIFHDGTISGWEGDSELLRLTVDCEYLAERIDCSYNYFFVELAEVKKLIFDPWMHPGDVSKYSYVFSIEDIFKAPLDILSAEIKDNSVVVACNQIDTSYTYHGGYLSIVSNSVQIFNQKGILMTIDELDQICQEYWRDFSKQVEKSITDNK